MCGMRNAIFDRGLESNGLFSQMLATVMPIPQSENYGIPTSIGILSLHRPARISQGFIFLVFKSECYILTMIEGLDGLRPPLPLEITDLDAPVAIIKRAQCTMRVVDHSPNAPVDVQQTEASCTCAVKLIAFLF
jgi:hypothetical protein